jgi:hypothetical protein
VAINAKQQAVIAAARRDLGCAESPPRSNGGACVLALQEITGALWQAWCASAVSTWWRRGGLENQIVTAGTAALVEEGRRRGWLTREPVMGSAVVWRPGASGHTELFIEWIDKSRGLARTIGGNTGDAVREHARDVRGAYFVTPPELLEQPKPVYETVYWWEDPAAEPDRHGLYAAIASRENAIDLWVDGNPAKGIKGHGNRGHVRRGKLTVRDAKGRLVPRFTFWTGPRKRSPDYRGVVRGMGPKARRDAANRKVEAERPGHIIRPRSRRVRVN